MAGVKFRQVHTSFWSDVKVSEDFSAREKLLFLYLLTNDKTSITGCYETTPRMIAYETGLPQHDIEDALGRLEAVHKVIRQCPDTHEILILNGGRFNWNKSPKLFKSVENYAKNIKNDAFREYVTNRLDAHIEAVSEENDEKCKYGMDTVSGEEKYPMDTLSIGYQTSSPSPSTIPIPSSISNTIPNSISGENSENFAEDAKAAMDAVLNGICPVCKHNSIHNTQGADGATAWTCINGCEVGWLDDFLGDSADAEG